MRMTEKEREERRERERERESVPRLPMSLCESVCDCLCEQMKGSVRPPPAVGRERSHSLHCQRERERDALMLLMLLSCTFSLSQCIGDTKNRSPLVPHQSGGAQYK